MKSKRPIFEDITLKNQVFDHLSNYYFDPDTDEPQDCTDEIMDMLKRLLEKNMEELRKDLKNCTPMEYWELQGAIMELKRLINRIGY